MFIKTLSENDSQNLKTINETKIADEFYLAGGSGCALQIGHRTSMDLDFFTQKDFKTDNLTEILKNKTDLKIVHEDKNTVYLMINKSKFSFIRYDYPLIDNLVSMDDQNYKNIKIASLIDIACMKLSAILQRGYKRDFIDLYAILNNENMSLKNLINHFKGKFKGIDYTQNHIIKSLTYFADADGQPDLIMHTDIKWDYVKEFFNKKSLELNHGFDFSMDF